MNQGLLNRLLRSYVRLGTSLRESWRTPVSAPTVDILRDHLAKPLTEQEKIPISQREFDEQIRAFHPCHPGQEVTADDLNRIFRVSETETSSYQSTVIERIVVGTHSRGDGTKDSFIGLWDDNIGIVLERVLDGVPVRYPNHHTTTALRLPDFGFLIHGKICLFRGEEKAPGSLEDPRIELLRKLIWTYDPLMYILGERTCPPSVRCGPLISAFRLLRDRFPDVLRCDHKVCCHFATLRLRPQLYCR